jgi:hypothetical protein
MYYTWIVRPNQIRLPSQESNYTFGRIIVEHTKFCYNYVVSNALYIKIDCLFHRSSSASRAASAAVFTAENRPVSQLCRQFPTEKFWEGRKYETNP